MVSSMMQVEQAQQGLIGLPTEITAQILARCSDFKDLLAMLRTCKRLHSVYWSHRDYPASTLFRPTADGVYTKGRGMCKESFHRSLYLLLVCGAVLSVSDLMLTEYELYDGLVERYEPTPEDLEYLGRFPVYHFSDGTISPSEAAVVKPLMGWLFADMKSTEDAPDCKDVESTSMRFFDQIGRMIWLRTQLSSLIMIGFQPPEGMSAPSTSTTIRSEMWKSHIISRVLRPEPLGAPVTTIRPGIYLPEHLFTHHPRLAPWYLLHRPILRKKTATPVGAQPAAGTVPSAVSVDTEKLWSSPGTSLSLNSLVDFLSRDSQRARSGTRIVGKADDRPFMFMLREFHDATDDQMDEVLSYSPCLLDEQNEDTDSDWSGAGSFHFYD
ncbi:hypothetical protein B0T22DRAFT_493992 [Podospora appendiculata]|uniref:F-box domain-containing protein n=1 Tax=Podospora appendiculata TaxID=314037 RepID=A0AAE0X111_9PEZI|nr:hypothetical protein B0T22DRAFT_493992 [Podospora appendiculata]